MTDGPGRATRVESPSVPSMARIILRPIGSPMPLGFLGLAAATTTLAGIELNWVPLSQHATVGLVLVAFALPLQLISSLFGFLARDTVCGTGMGVLVGTWLTLGITAYQAPTLPGNRALAPAALRGRRGHALAGGCRRHGKAGPGGRHGLYRRPLRAHRGVRVDRLDVVGTRRRLGRRGPGLSRPLRCIRSGARGHLAAGPAPMGRHSLGKRVLHGGIGEDLQLIEREAGVREQL